MNVKSSQVKLYLYSSGSQQEVSHYTVEYVYTILLYYSFIHFIIEAKTSVAKRNGLLGERDLRTEPRRYKKATTVNNSNSI